MEVLPAIIEDDYREVAKKLSLVASLVNWVQVDVCDGEFVKRTTWTKVEDLTHAPASLKIDLHIMVRDPLGVVEHTAGIPAIRRITFHYEATADASTVIEAVKRSGREAGIALNPETPVEAVLGLLRSVGAALVMGVHPGWGGQGFLPETPSRIAALKAMSEGLPTKVGVDGGVHLATGSAQACKDAGADYLVVGSGIFKARNIERAIREFQELRIRNHKSKITNHK